MQPGDAAQPVCAAAHHLDRGFEQVGQARSYAELVAGRRGRTGRTAAAGGEFHAALRVERPQLDQPGPHRRRQLVDDRPQHRALAGAGRPDHSTWLPTQLEPVDAAVLRDRDRQPSTAVDPGRGPAGAAAQPDERVGGPGTTVRTRAACRCTSGRGSPARRRSGTAGPTPWPSPQPSGRAASAPSPDPPTGCDRIADQRRDVSVPRRSLFRPAVSIDAGHRHRYTREARHHARARMKTGARRSAANGPPHRQRGDQAAQDAGAVAPGGPAASRPRTPPSDRWWPSRLATGR